MCHKVRTRRQPKTRARSPRVWRLTVERLKSPVIMPVVAGLIAIQSRSEMAGSGTSSLSCFGVLELWVSFSESTMLL